jgi:hypothetical protein
MQSWLIDDLSIGTLVRLLFRGCGIQANTGTYRKVLK